MPEKLVLPAKLDLTAASDLLEAFRTRRGEDVGVDAGAVTHLGTNCLQVLISASRSWADDGKTLAFGPMSEAFSQQLEQFGLSPDSLTDGAPTP
jgi:chemotaxis protein CheX